MTFRFSNRVKVTASAPGTAAFPATAAATGFIGFNSIPSIANGDIVPYTAWDGGANWETGWATYNSTGPVLTRTTIVQNSAGTFVAINFSSGIVTIYCDATAASLPLKDSSGNIDIGAGNITTTGQVSWGAGLGTSLALNGATLGSDKLAITGSARISNGAYFPNGQGIQWATGTTYIIGTDGSYIQFRSTLASQGLPLAVFAGLTSPHDFTPLGVYACDANCTQGAASAVVVGSNTSTGRSINAGGTINASNSDYAEYENKAAGCGVVIKGQIIGFDDDGCVTDKWANSISFGVKSTNPNLVGGDTWGTEEALGMKKPMPPEKPDDESTAAYEAALSKFNALLEAARAKVDRIAYCGKVPVNVAGAVVGDYIVAVADGAGIKGIAVSSPTFEQYRAAVGRVRRITEDGRPEIAVIIH